MKLIIEMPEEFEIHFMQDKFEDFFISTCTNTSFYIRRFKVFPAPRLQAPVFII